MEECECAHLVPPRCLLAGAREYLIDPRPSAEKAAMIAASFGAALARALEWRTDGERSTRRAGAGRPVAADRRFGDRRGAAIRRGAYGRPRSARCLARGGAREADGDHGTFRVGEVDPHAPPRRPAQAN